MPCEVTATGYLPPLMSDEAHVFAASDQPRQAASTMKHLELPKGLRQLGGGSDGLRDFLGTKANFGVRPRQGASAEACGMLSPHS